MISLVLMVALAASPTTYIVSAVQFDGETKEAFLQRTALEMEEWTIKSKAELCGVIARDEKTGQLGVQLVTTGSQISCNASRRAVPYGMVTTGESIHTHPETRGGRIKLAEGTWVAHPDLRGTPSLRLSAKAFSVNDYESGAGYLVTDGALYYQNGRGTQAKVADLH